MASLDALVRAQVDRVVKDAAVDALLHHPPDRFAVTPESLSQVLVPLRDMVNDLHSAGYRSVSNAAILASTREPADKGPTAMELIDRAMGDASRTDDVAGGDLHVLGVDVHPVDALPAGIVVAVAGDALGETPAVSPKPFVVIDEAGVVCWEIVYVDEASDDV